MNNRAKLLPAAAVVFLGGCASVPSGPSVMVWPASGKTFEQFREDDSVCRQYAHERTGATPDQAATGSFAKSATLGTLLGATAGAVIGAGSHDAGSGAAIGAGSGLLLGSAAGSGAATAAANSAQRRYDIGYEQCMYAKGNQVPTAPRLTLRPSRYRLPPPPPPGVTPPDYYLPPPGWY